MKTKRLLAIATAGAVFAGGWMTIRALAADNASPAPFRQRLQRIADQLNLTPDQRAQIKGVLSGERETLQPLLARLQGARENLRAAIQAGNANETSVRAASATVAATEADLAVERMKIFGKIAPILTDEQRRQLSNIEQRADESADNAIARPGERSGN
jgi:Spy/CpxP family protein refolding chaperone